MGGAVLFHMEDMMHSFPITDIPTWGRSKSWKNIEEWYTEMYFDTDQSLEQEVVPAFREIRAELEISGEAGVYLLRGPGGKQRIDHAGGKKSFGVTPIIRKGKHLYYCKPAAESTFTARLSVTVRRPLAESEDEAFVLDWKTMKESERQQMAGDRASYRIGRWSCRIKPVYNLYESTVTESVLDLNGEWLFHEPIQKYWEDLSGFNIDENKFEAVQVPHVWNQKQRSMDGYAWYRRKFFPPPEWQDRQVVLRFAGADEDALVFVNGHEAGYHQGAEKAFQFEIGDYLDFTRENILAVRLRAGRDRGGIYGAVEMAAVVRYGVEEQVRLHPGEEEGISLSLWEQNNNTLQPIGFGPDSRALFSPPLFELKSLSGDVIKKCSLCSIAGVDKDEAVFKIDFDGGSALIAAVRFNVSALKWRGAAVFEESAGLLRLSNTGSGEPSDQDGKSDNIYISFPSTSSWKTGRGRNSGGNAEMTIFITFGENESDSPQTLRIGRQPPSGSRWFEQLSQQWEEEIYGRARPHKMTSLEAAAYRIYKQSILLNSRVIDEDAYHGLLTSFDKPIFVIYWIRDSCFSVPAALLTGGDAYTASLSMAGATLDFYKQNMECAGILPDGTIREGHFSDGPALGVIAQYHAWCLEGDEWLKEHFETTKEMIKYLIGLDEENGDPLDGIIRSSRGDWVDYPSMRRYKRCGAVFFVNVIYLRALNLAAEMAEALGFEGDARKWRQIRETGLKTMNKDVSEGGYWLAENGHYADSIQLFTEERGLGENQWRYPYDIEKVTLFSSFTSLAHGIALADGQLPADRQEHIVRYINKNLLIYPYPAPAKYPFYDVLAEFGYEKDLPESIKESDPWELARIRGKSKSRGWQAMTPEMALPWKGWPGNHVWGGRWLLCGGWLEYGLWKCGASDEALTARANIEESLLRVRHPGLAPELDCYNAMSREETGSHVDPSGYYNLWSSAVPLQAIIEGAYGASPKPGGAQFDLRNCRTGDGLERYPVRNGSVTYIKAEDNRFEVSVSGSGTYELVFIMPWRNSIVECSKDCEYNTADFEARIKLYKAGKFKIMQK